MNGLLSPVKGTINEAPNVINMTLSEIEVIFAKSIIRNKMKKITTFAIIFLPLLILKFCIDASLIEPSRFIYHLIKTLTAVIID